MKTKNNKGSLVELTKFRNSSEMLALIEELELFPVRDKKYTSSRTRKQSNKRNSWRTY